MRLPPSTPHPELNDMIEQAKARPPMTPSEMQAQRISFAFGMLPNGSTASREDVAALDYAKYGNLAEMESRLSAAEAMAEALEFYAPKTVDSVVYTGGDDGGWRATAALEKWRAGR